MENDNHLKHKPFDLGGNPLDILDYDHSMQKRLCDVLESIADSLPDMTNPQLCTHANTFLHVDLPIHHADEEVGLFPLLEKRAAEEDNISEILAHLAMEHTTDLSFVYELSDSLDALSVGQRLSNPNMVGYMLRCFFECYKRHLQWEDLVVIPLARKRLNSEDLQQLSNTMLKNRQKKNLQA